MIEANIYFGYNAGGGGGGGGGVGSSSKIPSTVFSNERALDHLPDY